MYPTFYNGGLILFLVLVAIVLTLLAIKLHRIENSEEYNDREGK